jgi:Cell division protein FtsQ
MCAGPAAGHCERPDRHGDFQMFESVAIGARAKGCSVSRPRSLPALLALLVVAAAIVYVGGKALYGLVLGGETVSPRLVPTRATSAIGSGSSAVGVSAEGAVLSWQPSPKEGSLPSLPLAEPPKSGGLAGPALQQARVLGAAPAALRPYLVRSSYGASGVDVELHGGIELRFGDDSQLDRKWRAAAAVLASPSVTTLDYVDLHAPSHPATGGSGHTLPPVP